VKCSPESDAFKSPDAGGQGSLFDDPFSNANVTLFSPTDAQNLLPESPTGAQLLSPSDRQNRFSALSASLPNSSSSFKPVEHFGFVNDLLK